MLSQLGRGLLGTHKVWVELQIAGWQMGEAQPFVHDAIAMSVGLPQFDGHVAGVQVAETEWLNF